MKNLTTLLFIAASLFGYQATASMMDVNDYSDDNTRKANNIHGKYMFEYDAKHEDEKEKEDEDEDEHDNSLCYSDCETSHSMSWTDGHEYEHHNNHGENHNVVPIPPAVWLFGTGLLGLVAIARRKPQ